MSPFVVDGHGHETRTGVGKRTPRARIPGVLEPCFLAAIDAHTRGEIHRLQRSIDDDDLIGLAPQTATCAEVGGDLLAKGSVSGRIGGDEHSRRQLTIPPRGHASIELDREISDGRRVGTKGARRVISRFSGSSADANFVARTDAIGVRLLAGSRMAAAIAGSRADVERARSLTASRPSGSAAVMRVPIPPCLRDSLRRGVARRRQSRWCETA